MKKISFLLNYLKYLLSAQTAHGVHSPFVFALVTEVINKKGNYYAFEKIEQLRRKLLVSLKEIDVTDLGTGKSGKKTISEIAERSLKSKKYGQLLFRIVYHLKPNMILEFGTSLGISTSYLASANPHAKVITIEGCPNTAREARKNFESLGLKNIEMIVGNFDDVLVGVIETHCQLPLTNCQLVFFDGNHRKKPTLKYFLQCLEYAGNNSIFIFDDIHWSGEMENAWKEIKSHPKVNVTVDLFSLGLVFFRKEQEEEHFVIRY